jgi:hypothetical protein
MRVRYSEEYYRAQIIPQRSKKKEIKRKKALISYHLSQKTYFSSSCLSVCIIVRTPGMYDRRGFGTVLFRAGSIKMREKNKSIIYFSSIEMFYFKCPLQMSFLRET